MGAMDDGPASKRAKLEEWSADANACISIIWLDAAREPSTNEAALCHPEFTHQLFGEEERIFGYRGLQLDLTFSQRSFVALAELRHDQVRSRRA